MSRLPSARRERMLEAPRVKIKAEPKPAIPLEPLADAP
jgi:hypothetical protein